MIKGSWICFSFTVPQVLFQNMTQKIYNFCFFFVSPKLFRANANINFEFILNKKKDVELPKPWSFQQLFLCDGRRWARRSKTGPSSREKTRSQVKYKNPHSTRAENFGILMKIFLSLSSFHSQAVGLDSIVQMALKSINWKTLSLEQLHCFPFNT